MGKEMSIAEGMIVNGAETYLGTTRNIATATESIRKNPEGFKTRVNEFTEVCASLVECVTNTRTLDPFEYFNVFQLKVLLEGRPIPSIGGILDNKTLFHEAQQTYQDVNQKVQERIWEFPTKVTDEGQLTSGLLIEGYGLFLERLYDDPELARTFVLAFEEVLWNRHNDTTMLIDVLPWMIEERADFLPGMQRELAKLAI